MSAEPTDAKSNDIVVFEILQILTANEIPCAVAGGWALDLFLGRRTREHADLDLAIWRADQEKVRAALASDWLWEVADNGARRPWYAGEWLSLPIHEIHARPVSGDQPPLELLLNERDDTAWIYRRNPTVRRELNRAILVRNDIPFLAIAAAGADEQPEYPVS